MPMITLPARHNAPETAVYVETMLGKDSRHLGDNHRPVSILLPGGPGGNHLVYNEIKDELARYTDLVLWDPRSCGDSQFSDAQFCTIDHYIDDIEALRLQLNIEKPIIIGGSYGSMTALGYAIKYSKNLIGLCCLAGTAHGQFFEHALLNLARVRATNEQIDLVEKLLTGTIASSEEMDLYYNTLMPLYIYTQQPVSSPVPAPKPRPIHVINSAFKLGGFLRTFDWRPRLHEIAVPTRLICGDHDWINDLCFSEEMLAGIRAGNSDVDLVVLKNCGHFMWRDQREAFLEAVIGFVKRFVR